MAAVLERLIYASRWAPGLAEDTDESVRAILGVSIHNNRIADLTGLLVVHDGWFVQALEGGSRPIAATMERIVRDQRHVDVKLLGSNMDTARAFRDWNMAAAHPGAEAIPLLTELGMVAHFDGHGLDGEQALKLLIAVGDAERQRERRALGLGAA